MTTIKRCDGCGRAQTPEKAAGRAVTFVPREEWTKRGPTAIGHGNVTIQPIVAVGTDICDDCRDLLYRYLGTFRFVRPVDDAMETP